MLKGEPFFAMARPSFFVEFLFQPFRITGRCLTFFPICRRSSAKTISGVRSKNPMSFFQLIPQRQCCKPMNCCFIFRPQFGQTLLLVPIAHFFSYTFHHNDLNKIWNLYRLQDIPNLIKILFKKDSITSFLGYFSIIRYVFTALKCFVILSIHEWLLRL